MLKNARLSFPSLFSTAKFSGEDTGKYEATFLLNKEKNKKEIERLKAVIEEGLKSELKVKALPEDKICLKDGDASGRPEYEGHYYIKASTKKRPPVFAKDKSIIAEDDDIIYSGCYVNGLVGLWFQNNQYGKRINANLFGIQFAKDGEPFGTSIDVTDDFEAIDDDDDF